MKKKILSLDGGGSWAILQAIALKEIYKDTVGTKCIDILNQFDVISANSGGSLMLAGMIENADKDIDEVINMFLDNELRSGIFSKLTPKDRVFWEKFLWLFKIGPKYSASRKIDGLLKALKNTGRIPMIKLRDQTGILPHIVICGFDYDLKRAVFFKTEQGNDNYEYTLAEAVNAASNAPVNYFDAPVKFDYNGNTHQFWDGAIGGNNNPVLVGITEALLLFPGLSRIRENIQVLSIGTGNNLLPVKQFSDVKVAVRNKLMKTIENSSLVSDIKTISKSIVSEPPEAANFIAHMFLGGTGGRGDTACIVRMNPLLQPVLRDQKWDFPSNQFTDNEKDIFMSLIELDMDATKEKEVKNIALLGDWWVQDRVINQSILYNGKTLESKIGHGNFSSAKAAWLNQNPIV